MRRVLRIEGIHGIAGSWELGPVWIWRGAVRRWPRVGMAKADELV